MNKGFLFFVTALCFAGLSAPVCGQAIGAKQERTEVLESITRVLAPMDASRQAGFTELTNPFIVPIDEDALLAVPQPLDPGVEQPEAAVFTPAPVLPSRLEPRQVLAGLARQLRPRGSVAGGDRSLLMLERGSLRQGEVIRLMIREERYAVTLSKVTVDTFTLSYGGESLTLPVRPPSERLSIERAAPPNP